MKKALALVLLLALLVPPALAQEEPIPPKRSRMAKVGLYGGFIPGWLNIDVKPINDFIVGAKGAPLSDNGVLMLGGGGAIYIMVLPNVRIGGVGMGGSLKSTSLDAAGVRRDAQLNVGFGAATIEYVIPIIERLDVALGVMLGGGGIDLTMRMSNGGNNTWTSEQKFFNDGFSGTLNNISRTYSGSFFIWSPTLNVEYSLLSWFAVRLGASYVGMAFPSWQVDSAYDLLGVPSNVSGKGFMVSAGLLFGTF